MAWGNHEGGLIPFLPKNDHLESMFGSSMIVRILFSDWTSDLKVISYFLILLLFGYNFDYEAWDGLSSRISAH